MPERELPRATAARVHVLQAGYAREEGEDEHVGSSITLILDEGVIIVVDPGLTASRLDLLASLAGHGVAADDVTEVVFSHHHPDHTVNAALFPAARIHDYWAIYDGDIWISRPAEGAELSPSVRLIATPGHSAEDITTLAATPDGVYACTHAWWASDGPADDPFAPDAAQLAASRARILELAEVIIPGHGAAFVPDASTPR
jgi:glyoxylase-like metal-dependent hydrolase (beta-lactamase superfamily II)